MFFDRKRFFDSYREKFGKLSPLQVTGLSRLLDFIEADSYITRIPYAAYILATVKREAAGTYHPIHEYGGKAYFVKRYGGQTRKGKELGNDTPDEGYYYAGKGYPQTTGEANYEKAEAAIRKEYPEIVADFERRTGKVFDLTVGDQPNDESDPANMMDPAIAYATMSYGMRKGMFTGHKFSDHLDEIPPNYKQARRIINGTDHWVEIADDAKAFEQILHDSITTSAAALPEPPPHELSGNNLNLPELPPPTNSEPIAGTNIENIETAKIEAPKPQPQSSPVSVTSERVSAFAKIGAAFTAVTALGINLGNVATTKLSELTPQQIVWLVGACLLIAAALWFYDRAAKRAHEKTLAKMATASDPAQNTVTLKG